MELLQLEMFLAVYQERSFKRGAEKVYRSQPAVSVAIAKLEREIGSTLLQRTRGRREELHLTRAGELFYEYATQMIGLLDELRSALVPGTCPRETRLRLGTSEGWPAAWLEELVRSFRQRRPQVRVEVSYRRAEALLEEVRTGTIDLAIVDTVPRFLHGHMETMCVVAPEHRGPRGKCCLAWLLRNRAGRSRACLEFEQELRSSTAFEAGRATHGFVVVRRACSAASG
jgi:DNA-binding transcriptional LysR family regulator